MDSYFCASCLDSSLCFLTTLGIIILTCTPFIVGLGSQLQDVYFFRYSTPDSSSQFLKFWIGFYLYWYPKPKGMKFIRLHKFVGYLLYVSGGVLCAFRKWMDEINLTLIKKRVGCKKENGMQYFSANSWMESGFGWLLRWFQILDSFIQGSNRAES